MGHALAAFSTGVVTAGLVLVLLVSPLHDRIDQLERRIVGIEDACLDVKLQERSQKPQPSSF